MSASQAPGGETGSHHGSDGDEQANTILNFMQQAWLAGNGNYVLQLNPEEEGHDEDEDDDDFHASEEEEEEEEDEDEDEDEDPEDDEDDYEDEVDDDDDEEDSYADEGEDDFTPDELIVMFTVLMVEGTGRPLPYLTRRQLNLMFRGESLRNVLMSMSDGEDDREPDHQRRRSQADASRFPKVPSDAGRKLMDSGLFGTRERARTTTTFSGKPYQDRPVSLRLLDRALGLADAPAGRWRNEKLIAQSMIPASDADMVVRYTAPVYLGQFSDDGNFFYSATKDFRVRMYDTANVNEWRHYKTVVHPSGRWTLTDASLSPDNRWLAFTSMMPQVCLAPTDPQDEGDPYLLDLSGGSSDRNYFYSFAIFSVRFSGDGRELVAGTNANSIIVYDIESRRVLHHIDGHDQDVNAVCFGDKASPHLLYSGSDDATIKVWDRRSLGDGRPAGAFVGHCEGITYLDSKGDGRYILSNGKDQTMRLWDLRKAMNMSDFQQHDPARLTRDSLYDYRFQHYSDHLYFKHPYDNSVVTFRGHRVERTLIRCHFSPPGSSDGSYVYSASHSGRVYIWNLDATVAGVIDVRSAIRDTVAEAVTISSPDNAASVPIRPRRRRRHLDEPICVRDASWHPTAPVLVASGFDADSMETGTCSLHGCAMSQDGDIDGRQHRLYDDKLRPLVGDEALVESIYTGW